MTEEKHLKTTEAAKILGIHPSLMKYYEKVGKLPKPQRDTNNYRFYTDADMKRIKAHFLPELKAKTNANHINR